ncbi:MAG: ATP-binding protein, partial [Halobacteriaceae archaeon]
MTLTKRGSVTALSASGAGLAAVVLFDVYEDWLVQGNALLSTLAENSLPLALVAGLLYATGRLAAGDRGHAYAASVTQWTAVGTVTMFAVAGWVVGFQLVQGQLKPGIIVVQTTVVGAVAGLLVGRNTAGIEAARDELRREKRRFEALFENDPAAIADVRLDGELVVEAGNPRFVALFGDAGGTLGDATGAGADVLAALRGAVADGEQVSTETTLSGADEGTDFVVSVAPYEVDAGTDRGYVIFQDVTEMRRAEAELERTVQRLERSNEQLQQFAYVASHDLQEPLRMVSSYVDLLDSEYGDELDEEAGEYMEFAIDGAERMQAMIDDFLEYSRVHTRGQEFEAVDAAAVMETVRQDLELLIAEADAEVRCGDLPTVTADESQLRQLLQNLVKNAIDHGGDSPTVRVSAERRDGETVFAVADDGPGIPGDQQERIFELFEQGSRGEGGTGIGLAVCQRIVDRHDGDIWVESADGEGATFYF